MSSHQNPWIALPTEAPFVLPCDRPFIDQYNKSTKAKSLGIHTNLLPEPFHGNPGAPVVVLLLNPGVGTQEEKLHKNPAFARALRNSITLGTSIEHFHLVDESKGPGHVWWKRACKALQQVESLPSRLLSVEFSPYHSKSFGHGHLRLPSQEYSFQLVKQAMQREALIVCMRGQSLWFGAIPELATYDRLHNLRNPRSASLSPGNLNGFDQILAAVNKA
jgi:hypothetical protein